MSKQSYDILQKKIARIIAKLPSEHLLKLTKTQRQVRFWLAGRCFQNWTAHCWLARHTGQDDPLKPLLDSGQINQDVFDRIWLVVDFYEQLWGLVQLAAPYVQEEFKRLDLEYPFISAFELFTRLIWNEANSSFAVCLKSYYEASRVKYEQAYRLGAKGCREGLGPVEQGKLHRLLKQHQPDLLMRFVIAVCHQKSTNRRPALKSKLEGFYIALANLCDKEATITRKLGSFAWKNGDLGKGDKNGTYIFS